MLNRPLFALTRSLLIFASAFFVAAFHASPRASGQESRDDWNQFLTRESGWLGADGVYTVDLRFDARSDRLDDKAEKKVAWIFSDTIYGETKEAGREYDFIHIANHSFAVLKGCEPAKENVEFLWRKPSKRAKPAPLDAPPKNIIDGHYWLQDGVRYGDVFWCAAILVGDAWKPARIDAVSFPLNTATREPDFSKPKIQTDAPLFFQTEEVQIALGAAICDDADDGYIYVYGYVDRLREHSRKDAVVARVPRAQFLNFNAWEHYVGDEKWSRDIADLASPNAVLAKNVSTEFSVSRILGGRFKGAWILVYTPGCISNKVAYRLAKKPFGEFNEERVFYESNVPQEIRGVKCYNAKAHPAISNESGVVVSYNVNRLGSIAKRPEEYRPRFIELPWGTIDAIEKEKSKSNK